MKLGFICNWGKEKEKTWSGTSYGLYKELSKIYGVYDIDSGSQPRDLASLLYKFKRTLDYLSGNRERNDMNLFRIRATRLRIKRLLKGQDMPLFMFEEILDNYPGKKFIYQDLNAGYVKKIVETDPELFAISGFQNCSKKSIYKRTRMQEAFYGKVDKIFTMGEWLAKSLIEDFHVPAHKVVHAGGVLT